MFSLCQNWSVIMIGGVDKTPPINKINARHIFGSSTTHTEIPRTQNLTWPGFKLMISRSWQYISCRWDACSNHSNHSAITDFLQWNVLPNYLRGLRWFQMHWLSDRLMLCQLIFLVQIRLRQKYYASRVWPNQGVNSIPTDHYMSLRHLPWPLGLT